MYMCTYTHTHTHTYMYAHACTHAHAHMHDTHAGTHTHTHTVYVCTTIDNRKTLWYYNYCMYTNAYKKLCSSKTPKQRILFRNVIHRYIIESA